MLTTAAGTIPPAKVLVLGAGVAGLQAIATARRLGAVVSAFDVRPVVKEQVESLGATFLELDVEGAEGVGGYAVALAEDQHEREQELIAPPRRRVRRRDHDRADPRTARRPSLITQDAVARHAPGLGDRRPRGGGRRQLRRARSRARRRRRRRHHRRPAPTSRDDAAAREPDVLPQRRRLPRAPRQGRSRSSSTSRTRSSARRASPTTGRSLKEPAA